MTNQINLIQIIQKLPDQYINVLKKVLDSHKQNEFYQKQFMAFHHLKANIEAQYSHRSQQRFDQDEFFGKKR